MEFWEGPRIMKNKKVLSMILFVVGFVVTYLVLCYCIPGLRIKLAAEPLEYFIKSIKNAFLFKSVISCIVATVLALLPHVISNS